MNTDPRALWRRLDTGWLLRTLLVVLTVLTFRSAVADWNDVPTGSMEPTILIGDRIAVNKLAFGLSLPLLRHPVASWDGPRRGDVVTCWSPADGKRLVKRVIGLPGDEVAMRDGRLVLNGEPVAYSPLPGEELRRLMGDEGKGKVFLREELPGRPHTIALERGRGPHRDFGPVTVPPDRYLVLGDNRDNSADSRYFGLVPRRDITGRVGGVALSLDYDRHFLPRWERWGRRLI